MEAIGIEYKDRKIIHTLYKEQQAIVKSGDQREYAEIKKGVRQVCGLSPLLFNAYIENALQIFREEVNTGIKIHGRTIDMLRYGDDIAILAENGEDLEQAIGKLDDIMREYNMRINMGKMKVMV